MAMEDKIALMIRDEEETWTTAIIFDEADLLQILDLCPVVGWGATIDLPSVAGYAQVYNDKLKLAYQHKSSQRMVSAPLAYAKQMIDIAIRKAESGRRSDGAWENIWTWAGEHNDDPRWLKLDVGEQVSGRLLMFFEEHIALELINGQVRIASIVNDDAMPAIGEDVVVKLDDTNGVLIFRS